MEINQDILKRIANIDWFKNIGKSLNIGIKYEISYARDIKKIFTSII